MAEQKQTLKSKLTYWVECYKDVAQRNALAETSKESAEYLISLILAEVDKAGKDISLQGCSLETIIEAIKKQLRG